MDIKMRAGFFSFIISILLIMLIISGTILSIASAADEENTNPEGSTGDLIVENISWNPGTPEPGQAVNITVKIKNQGTGASEPTNLTYKIGEADPKTVSVLNIDPEASSLVPFTWTPDKEGTIDITAKIENREKTVQVTVAKNTVSSLTIENLSIDPENPKPDSEVTINALVKNQGDENSEPTNIIYKIGETEEKEEVSEIEAGSEKLVSHTWKTPNEEKTVLIKAYLENIEDSEKEISVEVSGESLPDLIIEDLYPESSTQPEAETPWNLILRINNQGKATASNSTAKYSINGISGGNISIPELSTGASTNAEFSLTPGNEENISVTALADSENIINESNEDNNEISKVLNLKHELPDLKIESISLNPEEPHTGDNTTFTVTIKNNGSAAAKDSETKYEIKGNNESYTGVIPIPALEAGKAAVGTFFWTPRNEGQIEVKAIVDAANAISESDETNNKLTKSATVSKEVASSNSGGGGSSSSSEESSSSDNNGGGSGSSSSGGSGMTFKEPASNVDARELSTRNIQSGQHVRFDFLEGTTCITYIEFDAIKTLKRTTTTVEVLKNKSVFVSGFPPGKIYKQVNIWVGNSRAGNSDYFKNGVIEFKVEKAWIKENKINQSQITLQWYNKSWQSLNTEKVKEDNDYAYFKSETPGFSCFAITRYAANEGNKSEVNGQGEMQGTLLNWSDKGNASILGIAENDEKKLMGAAKIFLAICLPLFLILVEYFIFKKKI